LAGGGGERARGLGRYEMDPRPQLQHAAPTADATSAASRQVKSRYGKPDDVRGTRQGEAGNVGDGAVLTSGISQMPVVGGALPLEGARRRWD
jgi:hypothetical protein